LPRCNTCYRAFEGGARRCRARVAVQVVELVAASEPAALAKPNLRQIVGESVLR